MSYTDVDTSVQDGEPIWLFRYARGTKVWRQTSDAHDYVADDGTYEAVPGGHDCGDIESAADKIRNSPKDTVSRENEIAELFRVDPPTDVISVVIRETHRGTGFYAVRFVGEVTGAEWKGASAELQYTSIVESANGPCLKLACSRGCQAMHYGPGCNLDPDDWKHDTTIVSIDGLTVELASVNVDHPYQGGTLLIEDDDGNIDRRMIESQDGTTLTLTRQLPVGVIATDAASALPGCNRLIDGHCLTVYDNTPNFRGLPHFAGKNPMDGKAMF